MGRSFLLRLILGVALATLTASATEFYTHETVPGDYTKKVDVDGRTREYRIHIPNGYPNGYPGERALPIIFAFHGTSASARVIEQETSLDQRADSLGFIAIYPEGLHRGWNIGECCRYSFKQRVDDTHFVGAILDDVEHGFPIDSGRVYAMGYSDGGTLSYLLACRMSNRVTAVAGISATLFEPEPHCDLTRPVPVMIVHGTGDAHIPYAGSVGGPPEGPEPHFTHSAPDVTQFWVNRDGCSVTPETVQSGHVVKTSYQCRDNAEVVFYTIRGGTHGWPGGGRGWIFSDEPPRDMVATDTVVNFFLRYNLRS